jgi:hypothetical protein
MMMTINAFVALLCARVSYEAFLLGLNTNGWVCLVLSAMNTASFLTYVI